MKTQTIDEHCGLPDGTFKKFIKEQEDGWKRQEEERKERIRKARACNGTGYEPDSA